MMAHQDTRDPASLGELLGSYRSRSGTEAVDVERVRRLLSTADDPWHRSTPLHVTVSAIIVHPPTRRVLLRWHERQQGWLQVGGHGDPGEEYPLLVALREGREESGLLDLRAWPDAALVHVVVVPVPAGAREPAHEHADLRFVLATGTPDAVEPENPAAALRWLDLPKAKEITEPNVRETLERVGTLFGTSASEGADRW
jgi:8-oxo-dGTP pyrophosphatase MutT (NUDIX family)